MNIKISSLEEIGGAAEEFMPLLAEHRIFAFYGGMGSGKTTFISALCHKLGVTDATGSPTFAIVNEYSITPARRSSPAFPKGREQDPPLLRGVRGNLVNIHTIYHFDFYRIRSLAEACDIGLDDYFYSGSPCLIEWPELIEPLLPEETVRVHITVNDDQSRTLKIVDK